MSAVYAFELISKLCNERKLALRIDSQGVTFWKNEDEMWVPHSYIFEDSYDGVESATAKAFEWVVKEFKGN